MHSLVNTWSLVERQGKRGETRYTLSAEGIRYVTHRDRAELPTTRGIWSTELTTDKQGRRRHIGHRIETWARQTKHADGITWFLSKLAAEARADPDEEVEFVHTRHPLMLLARHFERRQLSDTPWCPGVVPPDLLDRPTTLVWAIGSLNGYATRAELLCAAIDLATGDVGPITIERAQQLLLSMSASDDGLSSDSLDVEDLKTKAEQFLLSEFGGIASAFGERDRLLTEKAESAVRSHASRQLNRNERQLAKDDLNVNLRNMYLGWNRRIESETESRLAEISRKSGVRSSLEIIGMAVLIPQAGKESQMPATAPKR